MTDKITQFDKATIGRLRFEVDQVLLELGDRFGTELKLGNIRYTNDTFTAKLEASLDGVDLKAKEWADNFWKFGMEEDWLHLTFTTKGKEYKIVGLRPRARKQPILVESEGSIYQMDDGTVRLRMSVAS